MTTSEPSGPAPLLHVLHDQLTAARTYNMEFAARNQAGRMIEVPGIGQHISNAYEQLRRAAESAEEQLLLLRAIRRFYNRSIAFSSSKEPTGIGSELVLDLTHAGYLANKSVSADTARAITRLVQQHIELYRNLGKARIPMDERLNWVLDIMSAETETLLDPRFERSAFAYAAHQHFLAIFPREKLVLSPEEDAQYEFCLYIAVHQSLLKSDLSTVRHDLMRVYRQSPAHLNEFIGFNRGLDEAFASRLTQKLRQAVNRYGAPLRVVRALTESRADVPELLLDRQAFLEAYSRQVSQEYRSLTARLNRGINRSILFVFITKISVGLAIEIPYDILVLGSIAVLPLAINLLLPPLYMASFKFSLRTPTRANAAALRTYIDQALYSNQKPTEQAIRIGSRPVTSGAKVIYTLMLLLPLSLMVYTLSLLHFTFVQGVIFFVFLSTASFLGFRLSRLSRELELVSRPTRLSGAVRDFFYLPFIVIGQWISGRYARLNIIGYLLDIMVELPLKTALRLVRQWVRFLNEKHEEIY